MYEIPIIISKCSHDLFENKGSPDSQIRTLRLAFQIYNHLSKLKQGIVSAIDLIRRLRQQMITGCFGRGTSLTVLDAIAFSVVFEPDTGRYGYICN